MTLSLVFPGQGSQKLGMLAEFADNQSLRQCFTEASEVLGFDLWQLSQEGPASDLDNTVNTQPLLLTAGVALWRCWREQGGKLPEYLAGHSLGEWTALVCAESLDFAAALKLVRARGTYMQEALGGASGSMAAILGLGLTQLTEVCKQAAATTTAYVQPANINSPRQIVIAGLTKGVAAACELAKQAGAKRAVVLPVSVPSHCELMQPAAARLAADLAQLELQQPQLSIVQNIDAKPSTELSEIKQKLIAQLTQPVQWVATIEYLKQQGSTRILECGPGKVLTALNKSIDADLALSSLGQDPETFNQALAT